MKLVTQPLIQFTNAAAGFQVEATDSEGKPALPRFSMVAYTGMPMRVGGWRYPIVVDLAGLSIPAQNLPIRFGHDSEHGVGHTELIQIDQGKLLAAGVISRDTQAAKEVVASSRNGFPWQAYAIPGVEIFIRRLQQLEVPFALATSAIPLNTHLSLERLGLQDAFKHRITAADVTKGKPDPEPYLKAAALLNVPPSGCLVIEDSVAGVQAGKAAGAKVLAITTTFPHEILSALNPDWIASDFNRLPDFR